MAKTGSEKSNDLLMNPPEPQSAADYAARGWTHFGKREYYRAEADFRKALEMSPDDFETLYALGLSLQASGRALESVKVFERVVQMLESVPPEQHVRATMLTRLANDHIQRIKSGDTNPEKK